MKKFGLLLTTMLSLLTVGCSSGSSNPSDTSYWFSKHSTDYVEYSEETGKDDSYGTFFNFTSAKTLDMSFMVCLDVNNATSTAYLYLNGTQIKSEKPTGIYTFSYNLSLKKDDEIKLRAFNAIGPSINEKKFEITLLAIAQGDKTYLISEFNKTQKA